MLTVTQARARILAGIAPVGTETVPLAEAWNRVLAAPVAARLTQPPADISAMDGYALRAADSAAGTRLAVIGEAPAGRPFPGTLGPGEAVRLYTGSVIPAGADAVLLQEDARREGETVTPTAPVAAGRHIRRAGQDFSDGDTVLAPPRRLTARDIGLAAAANHAWLTVHRAPVVAILATGDEIALPGDPIPPGGIVSSNAHMLAALVRAAGGLPRILPLAADTDAAIADAARQARGADLLVTTGGASVGAHDRVQSGLTALGFTLDFWKIAMRPGKPMISGRVGDTPMLGLPGNPVSAAVCAVLFLLPALARLQGLPGDAPPTVAARAGADLPENDHREDHLRATLSRDSDGTLVATPFPRQDSGMLSLLARAEGLIVRPVNAGAVQRGEYVPVIELSLVGT